MLYWTMVFSSWRLLPDCWALARSHFAAAEVARILFFFFLVAFLVSLVMHLTRRRSA